jgi:hypothetical protein
MDLATRCSKQDIFTIRWPLDTEMKDFLQFFLSFTVNFYINQSVNYRTSQSVNYRTFKFLLQIVYIKISDSL